MNVRPMALPPGWYPRSSGQLSAEFAQYSRFVHKGKQAYAAIAPHAGWYFSGELAYRGFSSLRPDADCLIVFGGHRPAGSAPLMALEDAFESPEGDIESDIQLRDALRRSIETGEDGLRDNTVEVLLPFAKRLLPQARLLWIRVPNDDRAIEIGKRLAVLAGDLGRKAVAVGSTDLTHYGLDYDFHPMGLGAGALRWVREENDKSILDAFLAPDGPAAIRIGEERRAACSAGAAAAAMAFAQANQAMSARFLGYGTSADAEPSDRFVGYCSVSYERPEPD